MTHKHTPGPWEVYDWSAESKRFVGVTPVSDDSDICSVLTTVDASNRPPEESTANAHLIAAAPELLKALIWMLADPNDSTNIQRASAALTKAKGDPQP